MNTSREILLSVIIPTYRDWDTLQQCIDALASQDLPSTVFEIIVANNDPASPTPTGWHAPENCRVIMAETPGSYCARNAGLRVARGEFIAFTDSDCIPKTDWLSSGIAILRTASCDRVAGKIEVFKPDGGDNLVYLFEKHTAFRQDIYSGLGFCATANLITRKALFEDVGYFREDLLSGGDTEWNRRATLAGKSISYSEACVVLHPARSSIEELKRKARRLAGGLYTKNDSLYLDVLKSPFPSKTLVRTCFKMRTPIKQKLSVFMTGYRLKLYRSYVLLRLMLRIEKPSRS